jgi:hypothetical protein
MKVYKIYFFALIVYVLPIISLGIFIIDQMTINKTEMIFWVLFLISLFPCGFTGTVLSSIGLKKSFKNKDQINKVIGIIGVLGGLFFLMGGILGLMLIYIVIVLN